VIGPWMWGQLPIVSNTSNTATPPAPSVTPATVTLSTVQADMLARNKQILDLQKEAQKTADLPKCELCQQTSTETWVMDFGPFPYVACVDVDACDLYRKSISRPLET
jgi:hypothetical protein